MNESLEEQLAAIKTRNTKVELDKAWEISWTRKLTILAITYVLALAWLRLINESNSALKAFIPAVGYFLSTLTMPLVKSYWLRKHLK